VFGACLVGREDWTTNTDVEQAEDMPRMEERTMRMNPSKNTHKQGPREHVQS